MLLPFATQRGPVPASNFATGSPEKIGVVVHVSEGSADSAIREFLSPGAELSAHFVVAGPGDPYPDGTIFQLLDTDLCAYAQEAGNYPPTAYVAIEFSGTVDTPMSTAQVASGARIVSALAPHYGFPIVGEVPHGTPGVTTHCNPDGTPDPAWGDHPCPGPLRLAQIPTLVRTAQALGAPSPTPTPPPKEASVAVSPVVNFKSGQADVFQVSGGNLWHKWLASGQWHNECLAGPLGGVAVKAAVTIPDQPPQVAVLGGQCIITVEDSTGKVWYLAQAASSSGWGVNALP